MSQFEKLTAGRVWLNDTNTQIIQGTNVTRATVLAETEVGIAKPGLGSLYLSSDRAYLRVAEAGAAADWEKITTSAAD
jgi:hypothetical protein